MNATFVASLCLVVAAALLLVALLWALDSGGDTRRTPTRRQLRLWRRERADINPALNRH